MNGEELEAAVILLAQVVAALIGEDQWTLHPEVESAVHRLANHHD